MVKINRRSKKVIQFCISKKKKKKENRFFIFNDKYHENYFNGKTS